MKDSNIFGYLFAPFGFISGFVLMICFGLWNPPWLTSFLEWVQPLMDVLTPWVVGFISGVLFLAMCVKKGVEKRDSEMVIWNMERCEWEKPAAVRWSKDLANDREKPPVYCVDESFDIYPKK